MSDIFLKKDEFEEIFKSHIKIQTYSKSIDSLFQSPRQVKKINYKPYYQRNYVWDDSKATFFIESILLGTEIPPLIFFNEGRKIEVIDGRQRFETIKRFIDNSFSLSKKGLTSLMDLSKKDISSLNSSFPGIYNAFIDAKIRIIEFELVNQPPSNPVLIDKIKKEIFTRYNSGITPLKKSEIDNAIYDSDEVSRYFKDKLSENKKHKSLMSNIFLRQFKNSQGHNIESIMEFVRKSLVLYKFPIKYYASGNSRTEIVSKFYEYIYDGHEEPTDVYENYISKVSCISYVRDMFSKNSELKPNRLFWESILWGVNVIEQEGVDYIKIKDHEIIVSLIELYKNNEESFALTDSHYHKETLERFSISGEFLESKFNISVSPYIFGKDGWRDEITLVKSLKSDTSTELDKLETLRITKPDPSRNSVEDVIRGVGKDRFLIRPSYQRSEVINLSKASAVIESIILGIMLPAIFIYKRNDDISEVIDGQQRLLTILGFMGQEYLDEKGNRCISKNNKFKLKDLKILKQLNGKRFDDLDEHIQDVLWDFELFIVEIEEKLNPLFNPVDLFIRLNDKPFPIKDNSFEMWNSWADRDVVSSIKKMYLLNKDWFYIKNVNKDKVRDRMLNEELISTLAFFDMKKRSGSEISDFLDIYQKGERINARIKRKYEITNLLASFSDTSSEKSDYVKSIDNIGCFIDNLSILLNVNECSTKKDSLDMLLSTGSNRKYFQRTLQDLYILWILLDSILVSGENCEQIYSRIVEIIEFTRNIEGNSGYNDFQEMTHDLKNDFIQGYFSSPLVFDMFNLESMGAE